MINTVCFSKVENFEFFRFFCRKFNLNHQEGFSSLLTRGDKNE